ncbi:MAG: hypothetical protein FJX77_13290, partial [Armatimonadetes bacterium]|nr:hypothetical protein [Armatimonadota bacterium]
MSLTSFQRELCRIIAVTRVAAGESYLAVGSALNEWLQAPRTSRDSDLFHNTDEALQTTWRSDRRLLEARGFHLEVVREHPAFVEATVARGGEAVVMEWARDSAYRFFPLMEHPVLGLTLHPFDLATNKVLALVGRLEVRDWVDVIQCGEQMQPLGYLAWASCGKDPGFSPAAIVEHAARARYCAAEVATLSFNGVAPDAAALSQRWRGLLDTARTLLPLLPSAEVGRCVLFRGADELYRGGPDALAEDLARGRIQF